jgi:hypothetical protein
VKKKKERKEKKRAKMTQKGEKVIKEKENVYINKSYKINHIKINHIK